MITVTWLSSVIGDTKHFEHVHKKFTDRRHCYKEEAKLPILSCMARSYLVLQEKLMS